MSLEHAILGFLNYGPFSGYDLKKAFDQSIYHFWNADLSQIYRSLARLNENGWTETQVIEQGSRPDRKVYTITQAGREELLRWLTTPIPQESTHSANLVQVFFAGQLSDEDALNIFRPAAQQIRQLLSVYEQAPAAFSDQAMQRFPENAEINEREKFFWLLTLECGYIYNKGLLEWMESAIQRLENHDYTNLFAFPEYKDKKE